MGGVKGVVGRGRPGVESWTPQKTKFKENNQKPKPKSQSQREMNTLTRLRASAVADYFKIILKLKKIY